MDMIDISFVMMIFGIYLGHVCGYSTSVQQQHPYPRQRKDALPTSSAFDRATCRPGNDLPLEEHEHDEGRNSDDDHIGKEQVPLRTELAHEAVQSELGSDILRTGEEVERSGEVIVDGHGRDDDHGNDGWPEQWSSPEPKRAYDAVIVGAGGHGLATAYYLAKEHGLTNVAVLEKGWLGGGNTGRNTTILRSNYLWEESAALYEHALRLWEGLSHELNYNVMYSARGVMMLAHNAHDVRVGKRHVHANRLVAHFDGATDALENPGRPESLQAFCDSGFRPAAEPSVRSV